MLALVLHTSEAREGHSSQGMQQSQADAPWDTSGLDRLHKAFHSSCLVLHSAELHTRLVSACALSPSFMWTIGYPLSLLFQACIAA